MVLAVAVLGSALALGAVHTKILVVVAALCAVAAGLSGWRAQVKPAFPVAILAALAVWSALQAVPTPFAALAVVAPSIAETWARAAQVLSDGRPGWATLSLDPQASLVEALKWAVYAAVFAVSAQIARRHGTRLGAAVVVASAFALALATMGHRHAGAAKVFGFYEPVYAGSTWALSPLLNPNNLAGYLTLGTFAGVGLLIGGKPALRVGAGLCVACIVAVQLVAGSRGGAVTLGIGMLAVLAPLVRDGVKHRVRWSFAGPAVALVAVLGCGVALAVVGASDASWHQLREWDTGKFRIQLSTLPLLRVSPVFGIGRGAFDTVFPAFAPSGHTRLQYAENFVIQWAVEWGAPVAVAALGGLCWCAWRGARRNLGKERRVQNWARYTLAVAVVVHLIHNLVDVGLEVPGVVIGVATLSGTWYGARGGGASVPPTRAAGNARLPSATAVGAVLVVVLLIPVLLAEPTVASLQRKAIQQQYDGTDFASAEQVRRLQETLVDAMRLRPAEPYFPRILGLVNARSKNTNALALLGWSLERGPTDGRTHLAVAYVLSQRGARGQAILHLRLAVTYHPTLVRRAAELAVKWDKSEIRRAVPEGDAGVEMLVQLSLLVAPGAERLELLRLAAARNPHSALASSALASLLLDELLGRTEQFECKPAGRELCLSESRSLVDRVASDSFDGVLLRAKLMLAESQPSQAYVFLQDNCGRFPKRFECLTERIHAAFSTGDVEKMSASEKVYLVARCAGSAQCAAAAESLGDKRAARNEWEAASGHYSRAVDEVPSPRALLKLARALIAAGWSVRAEQTLRRVESMGADPKSVDQAKALRKTIRQSSGAD